MIKYLEPRKEVGMRWIQLWRRGLQTLSQERIFPVHGERKGFKPLLLIPPKSTFFIRAHSRSFAVKTLQPKTRNGFYRREQRQRRFNGLWRKPEPIPFTFWVSEGICAISSFSVSSVSSCRFIFLSSTRTRAVLECGKQVRPFAKSPFVKIHYRILTL